MDNDFQIFLKNRIVNGINSVQTKHIEKVGYKINDVPRQIIVSHLTKNIQFLSSITMVLLYCIILLLSYVIFLNTPFCWTIVQKSNNTIPDRGSQTKYSAYIFPYMIIITVLHAKISKWSLCIFYSVTRIRKHWFYSERCY